MLLVAASAWCQTRAPKGNLAALPPEVRQQVERLYSESGVERANAASRLGRIGSRAAIPYLLGMFGDQAKVVPKEFGSAGAPVRVGEVAGRALGDMDAVTELLRALRDSDDDIADDAADGLLWGSSVDRLARILPLAKDKDPKVRGRAVCLVASFASNSTKTSASVPVMLAGLKDEAPETRRCAAQYFWLAPDPRAAEPLRALLDDPDAEVRREAADALGKYGGAGVVDSLIAALKSPDWKTRSAAAASLGEKKDRRAVDALLDALKDESHIVRMSAVRSLGDLADPRSVEPVMAMLKDSDMFVRDAAAFALGDLKDPRAIGPLVAAMGEQSQVASAAAQSLKSFGAAGLDALIAAMKDPDGRRRATAAFSLNDSKDPRVIPALFEALKDGAVAPSARGALSGMSKAAYPHALKYLQSEDAVLRGEAAWVLGQIKDRRAAAALVKALEDPEEKVRKSAHSALIEIAGKDLGADPAAWRRWAQPPPKPSAPAKK